MFRAKAATIVRALCCTTQATRARTLSSRANSFLSGDPNGGFARPPYMGIRADL